MAERHNIENLIDVTKNVNFSLQNTLLLRDTIITQLNEQLRLIKIPDKPKLVTFVCEPDNLLTELHKFGQLVKVKDSIDYSKKTQPIISACCKGKKDEELYNPHGVAVDPNSGNITSQISFLIVLRAHNVWSECF